MFDSFVRLVSLKKIVELFANDQPAFFDKFARTYEKISEIKFSKTDGKKSISVIHLEELENCLLSATSDGKMII